MYRNPTLIDAAVAIGIPAVVLPESLLRLLLTHMIGAPELLMPTYVRTWVLQRRKEVHGKLSGKLKAAAALLEFCMRDVDDSDPSDLVPFCPYQLILCLGKA